mgnify:CR=1 FL=1
MKRVAFCTLGCKVNQYDSEAMLEKFLQDGYTAVPFEEEADVYVVNTCVVTGTGEKKSRQMVRRARKLNPQAEVVVAGCMAQRDAEKLLEDGVRLVVGNAKREEVVSLLRKAQEEDSAIAAVTDVRRVPFENLSISGHMGKTRAVLKIQEGCDRFCTYCIIPHVRGGIRSRDVGEIAREAERLALAGFQELVLTGIHLSSYGRDLDGETLLDAIAAAAAPQGVQRVRLGSLEPVIVTREFAQALAAQPKVCPQFHLALQSGSDTVLARMRRRYTTGQFQEAVAILRRHFPGCAITTDILTGFPGETPEEHQQTMEFVKAIAFSRVHVFPYSKRTGTVAADMPGHLPKAVKEERARQLIALGEEMAEAYARSLLGTKQEVLFEEEEGGIAEGYTPQYMRVRTAGAAPGELKTVTLTAYQNDVFTAQ